MVYRVRGGGYLQLFLSWAYFWSSNFNHETIWWSYTTFFSKWRLSLIYWIIKQVSNNFNSDTFVNIFGDLLPSPHHSSSVNKYKCCLNVASYKLLFVITQPMLLQQHYVLERNMCFQITNLNDNPDNAWFYPANTYSNFHFWANLQCDTRRRKKSVGPSNAKNHVRGGIKIKLEFCYIG